MTESLDCVVIGAGVVGLAIAREISRSGRDVVVLEAESDFGVHTSSRNSEVIHAGIYYKKDSLKARLCVAGKALLYNYCQTHQVPHKRIGKLIVARDEAEVAKLKSIQKHASDNGVNDLRFVASTECRELEPAVDCVAGLLSPSTGIVDSHALMVSMIADIEAAGGVILTRSQVSEVKIHENEFLFRIRDEAQEFSCRSLINSAGLGAEALCRSMQGLDARFIKPLHFAKGHYFSYQGKSPFNRLVYPIPEDGGLGVHATIDMAGCARFGPDVSWVGSIDYSFDETRRDRFSTAIKQYFPGFEEQKMTPGYTGIRPKLCGPGEPPADFLIQDERRHGVRGLVNLFGIESPGLTASLAIAQLVSRVADPI